jgi:hypothetical protein
MVHMKALSVLFNLTYPKVWVHILKYENTTFTCAASRDSRWCRPQSPCLNSGWL